MSVDISIIIGSTEIRNYKSLEIFKSIESLCSVFRLELILSSFFPAKINDSVVIKFNDSVVINGFVDRIEKAIEGKNTSFILAGRDKTGDLVDCSIENLSGFTKLNLVQISERLLLPFGIKVVDKIKDDRTLKKIEVFKVEPGETVYKAIEKVARQSGVLLTTVNGDLHLIEVTKKAQTLKLREGENILSANFSQDSSNIYSKYIAITQQGGSTSTLTAKSKAQIQNKVFDFGVKRFRPLVILAEASQDANFLEKRSNWEKVTRLASAKKIDVTVVGWIKFDNNLIKLAEKEGLIQGDIWEINELVSVESFSLGIDEVFLISGINFVKDDSGTFTKLSLVDKNSFVSI